MYTLWLQLHTLSIAAYWNTTHSKMQFHGEIQCIFWATNNINVTNLFQHALQSCRMSVLPSTLPKSNCSKKKRNMQRWFHWSGRAASPNDKRMDSVILFPFKRHWHWIPQVTYQLTVLLRVNWLKESHIGQPIAMTVTEITLNQNKTSSAANLLLTKVYISTAF